MEHNPLEPVRDYFKEHHRRHEMTVETDRSKEAWTSRIVAEMILTPLLLRNSYQYSVKFMPFHHRSDDNLIIYRITVFLMADKIAAQVIPYISPVFSAAVTTDAQIRADWARSVVEGLSLYLESEAVDLSDILGMEEG